ncbi:hypothetical protein CF327_g5721 [Tilletia walkeri]|uniref:Uncharacterized protein n=1 Tax=Tilletia walkeri TaxID=117179 RepID=A0A8X7N7A4_9BASI|nr:hypothetical protein CF327_g5721 [Tilletia walkeri]KAE8267737.1 hypothetical protein A4X09_0g4609 [Tilletia walkeri]
MIRLVRGGGVLGRFRLAWGATAGIGLMGHGNKATAETQALDTQQQQQQEEIQGARAQLISRAATRSLRRADQRLGQHQFLLSQQIEKTADKRGWQVI